METIREAAQARAEARRLPQNAPTQRRCQREGGAGSRAWTPAMTSRVQLRGSGTAADPLAFEGFASVTGRFYEMWDMFGPYVEQVHLGSFAETLSAGPDVPLVIDHVSSRRIARTGNGHSPLQLDELVDGETTGLRVIAPTLDLADPDTAYIVPKLRSGLIDEMSFRFQIVSGRWSDDWTEYHIHAVDIDRGDVSIVGYGANPHTAGAGLREQPPTLSSQARALLALSAERDRFSRR